MSHTRSVHSSYRRARRAALGPAALSIALLTAAAARAYEGRLPVVVHEGHEIMEELRNAAKNPPAVIPSELDGIADNVVLVDTQGICAGFCTTAQNKREQCMTSLQQALPAAVGRIFTIPGVGPGTQYDTVILLSDYDQGLGPDALAFYFGNSPTVPGTGANFGFRIFPQGFGGLIEMNNILSAPSDFTLPLGANGLSYLDVLGQETAHQFAAYLTVALPGQPSTVLLGRSNSHWSFYMNTNGSVMEGNKWRDEGNGSFRSIQPDGGFSQLDQYLWGFRPAAEVDPFFVIVDVDVPAGDQKPPTVLSSLGGSCTTDLDCCGDSGDSCDPAMAGVPRTEADCRMRAAQIYPQVCICCEDPNECPPGAFGTNTCESGAGHCEYLIDRSFGSFRDVVVRGRKLEVTIDDILAVNGPRVPDFNGAPKVTRQLFVLLHRPGTQPTPTQACIEGALEKTVRLRREWSEYFYRKMNFRARAISTVDGIDDLPLWEWGLSAAAGLPPDHSNERWTGGAGVGFMESHSVPPRSCISDDGCDPGQPCVKGRCDGSGGALIVETADGGARIESPPIAVKAELYNVVRVTMRATLTGGAKTATGRMFFAVDGGGLDDHPAIEFPVVGDGERHTYVAAVPGGDAWRGAITRLALAPATKAGSFDIDRVELDSIEFPVLCVGREDSDCEQECEPGFECRDGACVPPTPHFERTCQRSESCEPSCAEGKECRNGKCQRPEVCKPACVAGRTCVDGACGLPKACREDCECEANFSCLEAPACPKGLVAKVVPPDKDGDGVLDDFDNCAELENPRQYDGNRDGVGDACEDHDQDGVANQLDNCPNLINSRQDDEDEDGVGNYCDSDYDGGVGCAVVASARTALTGCATLLVVGVALVRRRIRRAASRRGAASLRSRH